MEKNKICVIACAVLAIDIEHTAAQLGFTPETQYLPAGLHSRPHLLREKLQAAIDEVSAAGRCSRIVVGYGVCGRGTVGIQARGIPLSIARVHDCIALFLGGDAEYRRQFKKYPGTYYLSAGWYEEKTEPLSQRDNIAYYGDQRLNFDEIEKKYGAEAARETFRFLGTWKKNYQRAAFIETGAKKSAKYEKYARDMARAYGWKYEKITGRHDLIRALLTADHTTDEILVVPPGHGIEFDAIRATLSANPVWRSRETSEKAPVEIHPPATQSDAAPQITFGLGIDAGGTYTDAVVYDLQQDRTIAKSKALTTKWDFTRGIHAALRRLPKKALAAVEMVSLSTTLATNAIVEGEGQKVGMILMPPYGRLDPGEIDYEPKAVIAGQLEISGVEIKPIDPREVEHTVRRMKEHDEVRAFAVSGYAGSINPMHELAVKRMIRDTTGLFVTCGHELSHTLNFKTRARTAMLNARIIPKLGKLLNDVEKVLSELGIAAPLMVVKGDGSLMSAEMAGERPVETILSGPAASVAGARHLTGLKDALVVDMGGTTTDTALLKKGQVSLCDTGSDVGGHKTHVKALDIRTAGLGGDSLVQLEKGRFFLGPRRVAPIAWLGANFPVEETLAYLEHHPDRFAFSTSGTQVLALTGSTDALTATPREQAVLSLLRQRPYAIDELIQQMDVYFERSLGIERLEEQFIVQRCGLTLTDILHAVDRFRRWDAAAAMRMGRLYALLFKKDLSQMAEIILDKAVERLSLELLKRQLQEDTDPDVMENCGVCRVMVDNILSGGGKNYAVHFDFKKPVVGIGAPIHLFLPQCGERMGFQTLLPENADVANAIGAITSDVVVNRQLRIHPSQEGGFLIEGIAGAVRFDSFEAADEYARREVVRIVRHSARSAGTGANTVEIRTEDNLTTTADGQKLFMGRTVYATIKGRPSLSQMSTASA